MSAFEIKRQIRDAVRDGIARTLAALGLLGIALVHLLDIRGMFSETPYLFWMYIGLIVGSVLLAGALVRTSDVRVWKATAAIAASVIVGYTLSRTTGLPEDTGDIGNWGESLGIASLFVEGSLLALSAGVLWSRRNAGARTLRPRTLEARAETLRAA